MFHDDNQALSFGRYYRAARFPVIPPEVTLLSYQHLLCEQRERLGFLNEAEWQVLLQMLSRVLTYMMCLPASSTFHHRTAGGLFYHSVETAAFAAEGMRSDDDQSDGMVLAAFLGGLLHDIGKIVSYFQVSKVVLSEQDEGFGMLNYNPPDREAWDPLSGSLWGWCREKEATHLALKYTGSGTGLGHEAVGVQLWRQFIPEELKTCISCRDLDAMEALTGYLDRRLYQHPLYFVIKNADRLSASRDVNPQWRWQPKRSDLHIVRRFIEYAARCAWNLRDAPFVMADIIVDGDDTGLSMPFFRASWFHLHAFHDYLRSEDMYGAAIPNRRPIMDICEKLEHYAILQRTVPSIPASRLGATEAEQVPAFSASLIFPNESDEIIENQLLAFFPLGSRIVWRGMPEARIELSEPSS